MIVIDHGIRRGREDSLQACMHGNLSTLACAKLPADVDVVCGPIEWLDHGWIKGRKVVGWGTKHAVAVYEREIGLCR